MEEGRQRGRWSDEAPQYGNVTGALSVTRCGTAPAMPGRAEIEALYKKVYG